MDEAIRRNATMERCGTLRDCRYLLHDRDTKFTQSFRAIIVSGRVEPLGTARVGKDKKKNPTGLGKTSRALSPGAMPSEPVTYGSLTN